MKGKHGKQDTPNLCSIILPAATELLIIKMLKPCLSCLKVSPLLCWHGIKAIQNLPLKHG